MMCVYIICHVLGSTSFDLLEPCIADRSHPEVALLTGCDLLCEIYLFGVDNERPFKEFGPPQAKIGQPCSHWLVFPPAHGRYGNFLFSAMGIDGIDQKSGGSFSLASQRKKES